MSEIEKSRILSIDPGDTTGIAFFLYGELRFSMTLNPGTVASRNFLRSLYLMTSPEIVIIEQIPPITHHASEQSVVFHETLKWFENVGCKVIVINPGQWKGLVKRTKITSTHSRDAADMAEWYYRSKS